MNPRKSKRQSRGTQADFYPALPGWVLPHCGQSSCHARAVSSAEIESGQLLECGQALPAPVCAAGLTSRPASVGGELSPALPCSCGYCAVCGVQACPFPAGRDGAAVDRVSDGPQRGGEGDAAARSRARRRPRRELETRGLRRGVRALTTGRPQRQGSFIWSVALLGFPQPPPALRRGSRKNEPVDT